MTNPPEMPGICQSRASISGHFPFTEYICLILFRVSGVAP
ncbi:Uncharacterized protein dnm_028780 [Desulfonema magnum]|uniref:Uncharacterized protein n=1 Tax=Desulfonema magnum TaxID=45655 RepID=A0A975BJJ6_9BACT|nr:Uncharacterized protein dnm_028780 [Desulfonema magnum]